MPVNHEKENQLLRKASGSLNIDSKLVAFFYELLRDHLPAATVETLVRNASADSDCYYTNGWLAKYAENLANRVAGEPTEREAKLLDLIKHYVEYFEEQLEDCDSPGTRGILESKVRLGRAVL